MLRSPALFVWLAACGHDDATEPQPTDGVSTDTGTRYTDTGPEPTPASCLEEELNGGLPLTVEGDTTRAGDDATGSCGGNGAEDVIYAFTPTEGGRFRLETSGVDTLLYVRLGCDGEELGCNDDGRYGQWGGSRVTVDIPDGETAAVVVDSYDRPGAFTLTIAQIPDTELTCDDRADEDSDGLVDCVDPDCATIGECAPECPDHEVDTVPALVSGTTVQHPDEHRSACGYDVPAGDDSTAFTAPSAGTYGFFLASYPDGLPVVSLWDTCDGVELTCESNYAGEARVSADLAQGETVFVVVDGAGSNDTSDYDLVVFEVGPEDCTNAIDDDLDRDPDCLDDDCTADPACDEACPDELLIGALPLVVSGTTYGRADDLESTCGGGGSDTTFAFRAPADGRYTFDTEGSAFDTVLSVLDGCDGPELGCDDDTIGNTSRVEVDLLTGQIVAVVLDAFGENGGPFQLRVQ